MAVSLVYDGTLSRVRTSSGGLISASSTATIQRSTNQIAWTTVRGGASLPVGGTAITLDDYEFTPDVPNFYRLLAYDTVGGQLGPPANANPYFETGVANWTASGGTFVRSTAQFHEGVASGLLTPNGVASAAVVNCETVTAAAGDVCRGSIWVRCAVARSVLIEINFRTAGNIHISTSSLPVSVAANTWTLLDYTATAPATTGLVRVFASMYSTPLASHLLYIDEAMIAIVGPMFTSSITPTLDGVWLKSISNPALNRLVKVRDWSAVRRRGRAGLFDVVGAGKPIAVSEVRGSRQWTLDVRAGDPAEAALIDAMLDAGDVILVHVPADSTIPGGYVTVGDSEEQHSGPLLARRIISLPLTEVAAPPATVTGVSVP